MIAAVALLYDVGVNVCDIVATTGAIAIVV